MTVDLDQHLENADWTKQTWDLPPSNGVELDQWLEDGDEDIGEFVQQPRFLNALPTTPWLQEWATRRSMTAAFVEAEHPRDPGGEGGGQFIEKGTAGEDGWQDATVSPERQRGRELLAGLKNVSADPTARALTDAQMEEILAGTPLDGGWKDWEAFKLRRVMDEGEEWWDIDYPRDQGNGKYVNHNRQFRVMELESDAEGLGTPSLRQQIDMRFRVERTGAKDELPTFAGPRGQTWADIQALGPETASFYAGMSSVEREALAVWTGDEYKRMNGAIRVPAEMDDEERAYLRRMDRAMAKAPDLKPGILYRGASVRTSGPILRGKEDLDDIAGRFPIGSRLQLAAGGFQASTPHLERAQQFGSTIFRIHNAKRGIPVRPLSYMPAEDEVLLDRHELYTVTGMKLETLHEGSPNEHQRVIVDVERRD